MPKFLKNIFENILPSPKPNSGPLITASSKAYAEMTNPPYNKVNTPIVDAFKDQHNFVTYWAVTEILQRQEAKNRAEVIAFFIKLAAEFQKLNNVNSEVAVLVALRTVAIDRLQKTWKLVPKALKTKFENMCQLIESDFNLTELRRLQDEMKNPCVPYITQYQTDVDKVETNLKSFSRGEKEKRGNAPKPNAQNISTN
ncbi:hypothetical protein JTE90_012502 [Oedothorax gibbosus]|uniref:Ras-GEF domain-containing protein n=1 Tax=Oedothorax gibbosus TaxID=931172 RepID=A0AAV6V035_9ARAC|nr:hypothetical protein JTE90_012502 [Oedothorax gibbosus]